MESEKVDVLECDGTTISGFLTRPVKNGKSLGLRRKRFYKLDGAVLSKHGNEGSPAALAINVQGAEIKQISKLIFTITLKQTETISSHDIGKDVIVFSARSERECGAWVSALIAAAQRRLKQYYEVGRVIGEGGFAVVRIGRCLKTKELRAIKTLKKDDTYAKLQGREIAIIKSTDHPNIVKTYDVFETKTDIHIVMEFMAGGMLYDAIEDGIRFSEADVVQFMREILDGILYLHGQGIVHRDLKPENVLCTSRAAPLHVKISDFGLSCITNVADLKANQVLMSTMIGTPEFIAPEIARQEPYTEKVDMWALGMLCYNVIAGTLPMDENRDLIPQIKNGVTLNFQERVWKSYSSQARSFLRALLCTEPQRRLSPLGCMVHPWLERDRGRASTKIGTHGRVSHRISRMSLVNRDGQKGNKLQGPPRMRTTTRHPNLLSGRRGWKTAFLVISAVNRFKWLVKPRDSDEMKTLSKDDSLGFEEVVGVDSDSDDSSMGSAKLAFIMKVIHGSGGQEKRTSQPTPKNKKKSQGGSSEKRVSQEGDVKSLPVVVLATGSSSSGSGHSIARRQTWRDRGKRSTASEGVSGAKKSRRSKDRTEMSNVGFSPLRKVSRKLTTVADNAGILGPLRKISRKISSVAGGKSKGGAVDDGDLELSLADLGVQDVDEGDLLLLEDGELCGPPSGYRSKAAKGRQLSPSPIEVEALSPVTPGSRRSGQEETSKRSSRGKKSGALRLY